MAATRGIGRIARLTLFSGPQCSLCDTAKAELAKVRQQRPFELETINIQDPGQDRWKRKYVYWIPALHIEGKEVAKGSGFVGGFTVDPTGVEVGSKEYVHQWLYGTPLYDRVHDEDVLGEERAEEEDSLGVRVQRCFNCGEPGHVVGECTQPVDRRLVTLSRQYFEFFRKDPVLPRLRVHEVEEWRRQRLEWLDAFDPGQIRGSLLREALGLRDGDVGESVEWLANIANWGYPPGWVGPCDPRERVWQRITDTCPPDEDEADEELLYIFAEGEPEVYELSAWATADSPSETPSVSDEDDRAGASSSDPPSRWATYPATYFLSSKLPVCTGWILPAIGAEAPSPQVSVSKTYTADREALWQSIIASPAHGQAKASVSPWRTPGGFCEVGSSVHATPPPPPVSPPPPPPVSPPPPPPVSPPPPPPSSPPPPHPFAPPPLPQGDGLSSLSRSPPLISHRKEDGLDMEMDSDNDDMDLSD
ncbi:hypothetical protein LXA43DRAFT_1082516 [Ganoderma leucocontextum]|nr:hypothetical protein LXA43DRAFT_1082516 [Ganoderma leucocontextum]